VEKVRYMISDAAEMVHVETHVLRYWEEELELIIPRNEMGHRYYTRENIKEFQRIKELKDQGYQLKAIRVVLHSDQTQTMPVRMANRQEDFHIEPQNDHPHITADERMSQFRELMSDIVGHAIAQNNEELSQTIGKDVEERILKEMNYLLREQDNAQEDRFRKLDAAIRGNVKRGSFAKEEKLSEKKESKNKGKHRLGFSKA
jgi:DNA-binding transcriptional MerR regulator